MNQTLNCASHPVHRIHLLTKTKLRALRVIRWQKKKNPVHQVHLVTKTRLSALRAIRWQRKKSGSSGSSGDKEKLRALRVIRWQKIIRVICVIC